MLNQCISKIASRLLIVALAIVALYFLVAILVKLTPWSSNAGIVW